MRAAAKGLKILLSVVGKRALVELDFFGPALICAISGIALSNIFFVLSSVSLFRLAKRLGFGDGLAKGACLIYAFNPATVFYSSIYTESMYNFLHFEALVHLFSFRGSKCFHGILCTGLLSAATFARSNGILSCALILAMRLRSCVQICVGKPEKSVKSWRR